MTCAFILAFLVGLSVRQLPGQDRQKNLQLTLDKLELHNVKAKPVRYRGQAAMQITAAAANMSSGESLAIVRGSSFEDGTIDVDMSGNTAPNAPAYMRGFVGVAFRVTGGGSHFECFYLRPKNGRSEDQLQRNHSVQYVSIPGFGWQKLRSKSPGEYESYADLVPGAWTHVKIWVEGPLAQLSVGSAKQPVLVVNDLKQPIATGSVALWVGPGTIADFSDLEVTHTKPAKPSGIDGTWLGTLKTPKRNLRVVLHIFNTQEGLRATLESPDQTTNTILATSVTRSGLRIAVEVASIGGSFEGTIDSGRANIQGTWTQGGASLPLLLNRVK